MSVQFGHWSFAGESASPDCLTKLDEVLSPYGPDRHGSYCNRGVNLLFYALNSTRESHFERQPYITAADAVVMWDGRLDNRRELIRVLGNSSSDDTTDIALVATAYERWGTECFPRLIGDWAMSVWDPGNRSLLLAKDYLGIRPLYYSRGNDRIVWCTILDPLIALFEKKLRLREEYVAGWIGLFPATHLSPYVGIDSVPPSSFVHLKNRRSTTNKYWDFDPCKRIRYRTDVEYEEHFRFLFAQCVERRLRSDKPVLAELSGGMDSSSIVCMADTLMRNGCGAAPRLDTVSYFDNSEPNWNERPFFARVEEKRGRAGCHIDVSSRERFDFNSQSHHLATSPGALGFESQIRREFAACITANGNRVLLSGTGGDEISGGAPTPSPELRDLLTRAQVKELAHKLKVWALNKQLPWFYLLLESVRDFLPSAVVGVSEWRRPPDWLNPRFVNAHYEALSGYESRLKLFGSLPSFQQNRSALDAVRRQLGCNVPASNPPFDKRYPYLDRDLVEFMYAIPREQVLRPGQRRSLLRRALAEIVPDELLNRKRKAFVSRGVRAAICDEVPDPATFCNSLIVFRLGIVDRDKLEFALRSVRHSSEVPVIALTRTLLLECWLRNLARCGLLIGGNEANPQPSPCEAHASFSAEN